MITLKHLARTLGDIEPYKLRQLLREHFGEAPGGRWRWKDENDKHYKKVLAKLRPSGSKTKAPTTPSSTTAAKSSHKGATNS